MEYILCVFTSRTDTLKLYNYLQKNGVYCQIVNTPKEAKVGCGLSLKTSVNNLNLIKRVINSGKLNSFAGFFKVLESYKGKIIKPL